MIQAPSIFFDPFLDKSIFNEYYISVSYTHLKSHANIRYFGFVSHERALELQAKAALLINPRSPKGVFTRYSFPSKTLEYMRSGKPVVCHRLEGIPEEYDPYLQYIEGEGAGAIVNACLLYTSRCV